MNISLEFELLPSVYVYSTKTCSDITPLMSFREAMGETYILQKEAAEKNALEFSFPCRCIRLDTPTALTDVGITARVSKVLAQNDIPCNVVAAYHHDYFFVPESLAMKAKQVLDKGVWKPKNSVKIKIELLDRIPPMVKFLIFGIGVMKAYGWIKSKLSHPRAKHCIVVE